TVLSGRKDFTNSMVDFLNTASDNLTATDSNADGAALLALQTRQQIAASTLTFTTNADANVLRLFGLTG
ncbi:MAG: ABC transporter substrate-binding protein, partial [Pseudolabrys sp.]